MSRSWQASSCVRRILTETVFAESSSSRRSHTPRRRLRRRWACGLITRARRRRRLPTLTCRESSLDGRLSKDGYGGLVPWEQDLWPPGSHYDQAPAYSTAMKCHMAIQCPSRACCTLRPLASDWGWFHPPAHGFEVTALYRRVLRV